MNRRWRALAALMLGLTLLPGPAFAYVDPGILGVLYQAAYVAIFGVVTAWVVRPWQYVRKFLSKKRPDDQKVEVGRSVDHK